MMGQVEGARLECDWSCGAVSDAEDACDSFWAPNGCVRVGMIELSSEKESVR